MRGIGNSAPTTTSPLGGHDNGGTGGASVVRSRTLPSSSRRRGRGTPAETEDEGGYEDENYDNLPSLGMGIGKENMHEYNSSKEGVGMKSARSKERKVLKKQRRVSAQTDSKTGVTTGPVSGLVLRS